MVTVDGHKLLDYVVIIILLLMTLFAIGIIGYDEIVGKPPDTVMLGVLTFILGFLSGQLGVQRGASVAATATDAATTNALASSNGHTAPIEGSAT